MTEFATACQLDRSAQTAINQRKQATASLFNSDSVIFSRRALEQYFDITVRSQTSVASDTIGIRPNSSISHTHTAFCVSNRISFSAVAIRRGGMRYSMRCADPGTSSDIHFQPHQLKIKMHECPKRQSRYTKAFHKQVASLSRVLVTSRQKRQLTQGTISVQNIFSRRKPSAFAVSLHNQKQERSHDKGPIILRQRSANKTKQREHVLHPFAFKKGDTPTQGEQDRTYKRTCGTEISQNGYATLRPKWTDGRIGNTRIGDLGAIAGLWIWTRALQGQTNSLVCSHNFGRFGKRIHSLIHGTSPGDLKVMAPKQCDDAGVFGSLRHWRAHLLASSGPAAAPAFGSPTFLPTRFWVGGACARLPRPFFSGKPSRYRIIVKCIYDNIRGGAARYNSLTGQNKYCCESALMHECASRRHSIPAPTTPADATGRYAEGGPCDIGCGT